MMCAVCFKEEAVTQVGPLWVCSPEDGAVALERLGYVPVTADVVTFLEQIDPKELQNAAVELVTDYAEGATGRAFLSVLIDAAKAQV